mgnify:CR=1 FL=1
MRMESRSSITLSKMLWTTSLVERRKHCSCSRNLKTHTWFADIANVSSLPRVFICLPIVQMKRDSDPLFSLAGIFKICPAQPMYLWLSILIMYLWLEYLWLGFDLEGRRVWFGRTAGLIWKDASSIWRDDKFDLEGREATWVNPRQKKRSWPSWPCVT